MPAVGRDSNRIGGIGPKEKKSVPYMQPLRVNRLSSADCGEDKEKGGIENILYLSMHMPMFTA
jgi:hypothetical protein